MHALRQVLLLAAVLGSTARPAPEPTTDLATCRTYFHDACSDALGRWLPREVAFDDTWLTQHGRHIVRLDRFMYEKERPATWAVFDYVAPSDGTFFVYGNAGPPQRPRRL
jgi:hypothetical protein